MSTITELEDKVKELMNEIETLKREKKNEKFEYPFQENENYWFVGNTAAILLNCWNQDTIDIARYEMGNAFSTKEAAQKELEKRTLLTRFRQFRDKCNGDLKPDFDEDSLKYYLSLNHKTNVWKIHFSCNLEDFNLFGYFRKESDARRAIELFGNEIKRLWVNE